MVHPQYSLTLTVSNVFVSMGSSNTTVIISCMSKLSSPLVGYVYTICGGISSCANVLNRSTNGSPSIPSALPSSALPFMSLADGCMVSSYHVSYWKYPSGTIVSVLLPSAHSSCAIPIWGSILIVVSSNDVVSMVLENPTVMLPVIDIESLSAGTVYTTIGANDGIESDASTFDMSDSFQYLSNTVAA